MRAYLPSVHYWANVYLVILQCISYRINIREYKLYSFFILLLIHVRLFMQYKKTSYTGYNRSTCQQFLDCIYKWKIIVILLVLPWKFFCRLDTFYDWCWKFYVNKMSFSSFKNLSYVVSIKYICFGWFVTSPKKVTVIFQV